MRVEIGRFLARAGRRISGVQPSPMVVIGSSRCNGSALRHRHRLRVAVSVCSKPGGPAVIVFATHSLLGAPTILIFRGPVIDQN
jgi:hypothetical protein